MVLEGRTCEGARMRRRGRIRGLGSAARRMVVVLGSGVNVVVLGWLVGLSLAVLVLWMRG